MFEPLSGAVVDCIRSLVVAAVAVILVETYMMYRVITNPFYGIL
jgi:hypothetical protein